MGGNYTKECYSHRNVTKKGEFGSKLGNLNAYIRPEHRWYQASCDGLELGPSLK